MKYILTLIMIAIVATADAQTPEQEKVCSEINKLLQKAVGEKYSGTDFKSEILAQEFRFDKFILKERVTDSEGVSSNETSVSTDLEWSEFNALHNEYQEGKAISDNKSLIFFGVGFTTTIVMSSSVNDSQIEKEHPTGFMVYVKKKDVKELKKLLSKLYDLSK